MRRLYLLRHAKSSWAKPGCDQGPDDFDRPLNDRGRKAARLMAKHMAKAGIRPALVLCSAARRTRETWDIVEKRLEGVPVSIEDGLYAASKGILLDRLHGLDDHLKSVLLIGHNPGLERLAAYLAGHHGEPEALARLADKFPTGGLAVLECKAAQWAELDAGTSRLAALVRPRDLGDGD